MERRISDLWRRLPSDLASRMDDCFGAALEKGHRHDPVCVFFRADDAAVPGANFVRLMDLFTHHRAPLCLAVVPAWLTRTRWEDLQRIGRKAPSLWCWHQHGWRHVNHEPEGKKQEFGPTRTALQIRDDLVRGKRHLETLMGDSFCPVFTPPWNRCDQKTLHLLTELKYKAVSRFIRSAPPSPDELPDFAVHVDLHTRKADHPLFGWDGLFSELGSGLSRGLCGIMIHHRQMNGNAFLFLEILIRGLMRRRRVRFVHFTDLLSVYATSAPVE